MSDRAVSLRSGFLWTISGNVVNGVSSWAMFSVVARLGSAEMLGEFALAMAITMPAAMLAHLNLRAVLATDVELRNPLGDYFTLRRTVDLLSTFVFALMAAASAAPIALAVFFTGLARVLENTSDLRYALMQRDERMDLIAKSMILRAVISTAAVGAAVWIARSAAAAAIGLCFGRLLTLALFDRPLTRRHHGPRRNPWALLRTAAPLGATLLLIALTANVPRYAIERYSGTAELGIFAAVASLVTAGSTVVNALGQTALTRMARHFSEGQRTAVRKLAFQMTGVAVALTVAGALASAVAGESILAILYRPDFAPYAPVLTAMVAASGFGWIAVMLGFVSTSLRLFGPQMLLLAACAVTSGVVSFAAVPQLGLYGAVLAIGAAGVVQTVGQAIILSRAL